MNQAPIKIGLVTDQTGPLSFLGIANANLARLVVDEMNAAGGLLGRRIELITEDSATDDSVAAAKAAKLVQRDRVDAIFGGIYSSTRQAIKGPAVVQGKTLYIYPEQYEGEESDPLIFCTGPVPAQQVDSLIPWLMKHTDARRFYLPSADYIWPHVMNKRVRAAVTAHGGSVVGEEYFPVDHTDYRDNVATSWPAARRWSSTPRYRLAWRRSCSSCTRPVSRSAAAASSARTSRRTSPACCRPSMWKGSTAASTTIRP